MSVNSDPCINDIISFLERITGRLSFEEVEKLFSKGLDKNPIFTGIRDKGAFGKNIVVLLGGRGCGKTLAIRYIKHYLSKTGWDFMYINGVRLKGEEALKLMRQIEENAESKLKQDSSYKVIIAIDDVVEADEAAREYLKDSIISLVHKYAGRVKLVLAAQSERVTAEGVATIQLLKLVLGEAPHAEMFFGERPIETIEKSFKSSYIARTPVALFRGAAIVNLDAYWSNLRSLENLEKLADVIVEITDFYVSNIDDNCSRLIDKVKKYKYGLALLALSSLPKIAHPVERIVIEYKGPIHPDLDNPISALNGLGIAELMLRFFTDEGTKRLAEKAERIYNYLKSIRVENIGTEDVKEIILNASEILPYVDVVREGAVTVLGISLPQETGEKGKRRKYGPKIDLIYVKRSIEHTENPSIVLHDLRTDKRGYISSSSLNKLRKLIEIGIPGKSELRYLVVIVPSRKHMKAIYRCVPITRIGEDVLVLLADTLSNTDRSLIYLLYSKTNSDEEIKRLGFEITEEILHILYKIVIGTVLFNLRDHNGVPQLVNYLLPTIHDLSGLKIKERF